MNDLEKRYYKISEVADILEIPMSTLRYWESQFTIINPKRTGKGTRMYSASDIEKIRMVYYLVKERGMKIDAAQEIIKHNHSGVSKHYEAIERLKSIKAQLLSLLATLDAKGTVKYK